MVSRYYKLKSNKIRQNKFYVAICENLYNYLNDNNNYKSNKIARKIH